MSDKLYKQIKSKGDDGAASESSGVDVAETSTASYSEQGEQYRAGNIAVAVAMDDGGLITPVLQNADQVTFIPCPQLEGFSRPRQSQTATTGGVQRHLYLCRIWGCLG